jgi:hypothetical protein
MACEQSLAAILDETAEALSHLDLIKLQGLEQRILLLAQSSARLETNGIDILLPKRSRLEIILQNCKVNLDALRRFHARNARKQWAQ